MLSAETEVRNGIVAAMHASRCNVVCQTDNSDITKLHIKPVNLEIAKFVETDTSDYNICMCSIKT